MRLKAIRPDMCQELLDDLQERGLGKTNNEIYSILNNIMKNALAHGVIKRDPMAIVIVEKHKSTHGKALTKQEEKTLLEGVKGARYEVTFALALYTGLRLNEYYTARVEGDMIIAKNSKRKGGKIEYKKIPKSCDKLCDKTGKTSDFCRKKRLENIVVKIGKNHRGN